MVGSGMLSVLGNSSVCYIQNHNIVMFSSKMLVTLLALIAMFQAQAPVQSFCPQLCTSNCSNGNCTACYSSFALGAPQSTCNCPTSTFLNNSSGLCTPCPITCQTCSNYSRCMTCAPGFLLSNSFTCIPGKLNANGWVSKDISYDLTGSNLSGADLQALINSSLVLLNSNNNFASNCSKLPGFNWLGGYQAFGYTTKVVKKVYALSPHQWMNIRFQAVLIDKWVGNTLLLEVPSPQTSSTSSNLSIVWQGSFVSQMRFADFCGNSSIPDNLAIVDAWIPHNLSSTYFRIRMNQSDTPFNASSTLNQAFFAIRQLYVRVGTCGRGCRYCSSPSQCTQCILPYTLSLNGTCICNSSFGFVTASGCEMNCLSGYYYNATANNCLNCEQFLQNCQTCNATTCLTCALGFFYSNSGRKAQCVRYCPDTFTESRKTTFVASQLITVDSCVVCPANCRTCNYDLCLFCVQGFMYYKGTCVATCPQGSFAKEGSCLRCPLNCLNCASTISCSLCSPGYFPTAAGNCSPYCDNTTIIPNATRGCNYHCSSNCLTCFGPNSNQCLSCSPSTYLQAGQCVSTCSIGFYQSSSQCLLCSGECYSCSHSQSCLTCTQGYYLIFSGNSNTAGSCVRLCPSAYYPMKTAANTAGTLGMGKCVPCPTACQRCKNPSFCMSCSENYYYFNLTCLQSPPTSYYYDLQMGHFKPCQPNCLQCDELVCSLCASGYFLDQGTCVTDCGPNKIKVLRKTAISSRNEDDEEDSNDGHNSYRASAYTTNQNGFCEWRSPKCEVYDSSKLDGSCTQCSTFMPNIVLRKTTTNVTSCFFNCPEFYTKSSSSCVACPSNCRRCNSNMQCLECLYNYVINNPDLITSATVMTQTCVPNYCADNYYSDSVQCQKCTTGCAVCQIDGQCLSCIPGYLPTRERGICYPQNCTSTQYLNSGSCTSCLTPCLTCSSATKCTSCYSSSSQVNYLFEGACTTNCPGGYFVHRDSRTCRKCNPKCSSCQHFYNCLACIPNFYLLSFYNQDQAQCVTQCPIGFYSNTLACLSCSRDCRSCYGPSQYQCLTCYSNFVLDEGKCVYQCADAKYVDEFGHCDWCDSSCNDCNGPTSQNCISCGVGYYISDNVCYKDTCPGATYLAHFEERICDRCQFGCAICNSPQFCKFCFPGYSLYRGWCYLNCPGNLISATTRFAYLDNIEGYICKDCLLVNSLNCRRCHKKSCTRCANGYLLYRASTDQCVTACPNGTYVKSYEAKECVACQPYCTNCINYQNCLKCSYPYNLINGYCSASCPAGSYLTAYQNCSICPSPCVTCTTASSCSSCLPKFYLFANSSGNACLTDCPAGYFADARSGWCSRCLSTCSACVATNNCTQCAAGYTLSNGVCQNQTTCLTSLSNCQSCNNQSCLRCVQPFLLYINRNTGVSSCLSTCPTGYYSSVFTCEACNSSCTTCVNTPNSCSQCQSGLYLYGQSCVAICPIGFYANITLKTCQSCPSNCLNCQQSTCYACQAGFLLYLGQCYSICPSTTYASVGMGLCYECPTNCTSCLGDENCTSCVAGTLLYNGTCSESCPMTAYNSTDAMGNYNCQPCPSPCYTCTDQDTCISCIPNYILNGTVCQQACNVGYYSLTLTLSYDGQDQYYNFTNFTQCYPCDPACSICSTAADDCQACNDPYILYGGKCLANCPLATFFVNNSCISCSYGCFSCNSSAACQVCVNNTVLYMGQCLRFCPDGFYANSQANSTQNQYVCQPCSSNCRTCSGPSLYECTSCTNNTYLATSGDCLIACPTGTYINNFTQSCIFCPYGCSQCTSPTNCSVCISNFTLTSTKQCKYNSVCNVSNCLFCLSANSNACAQCLPSYLLYNNSCITTCPLYNFVQNGQCNPCSSNCLTCTSLACINCTNTTFLYQGICVVSCPVGTYPTVSGNCQIDPCLAYNSGSNDCLQCAPPYLLVNQSVTITNTVSVYLTLCMLSCPYGFVQSGSSCSSCSSNCLSCVSSTICSKCTAGTYLYQGLCILSCPLGTFGTNYSCQSCSLPYCSQCVSNNSTQACTSCTDASGAYLVNGNCVFVCPSGTYRDATSQSCLTCSSNCISCSNSQSCSSCSSGYFLYLGQCVNACPSGTFASGVTCNPCSTGCFQCSNSYNCSLCQSQYSLLANNNNSTYCVSSCPTGYYSQAALSSSFSNSNQFKCVSCMSPCLTCTSALTCTQCASGYSLLGSLCVIACPAGYYMGFSQGIVVNGVTYTTSTCYSCSASCLTCNNTSTYCLSCPSGYILDANNNCVSNCVSPTSYYSPTTRMCSNCSQQCYSCYGPGTDNCLSCRPPLQLYASSCLSNCPFGYFSTPSYACQVCSTLCLTCSASANNCTSCPSGLYLQTSNGSSVCKNTCPIGYYLDPTMATCAVCVSPCLTCSRATQCLTCPTGYYFYNQACLLVCLSTTGPAFTSGIATCSQCPANCINCVSTAAYMSLTCTQCSTGYYLVNGACSQNCPSGTYASPTSYSCTDCGIIGCQTCFLNTALNVSCAACLTTYYSYNGTCVSACPISTIPSGSSCVLQPVCQGYQWNGYCLASCPTGTFPTTSLSTLSNTATLNCSSCSAFCTACTSSNSCSSCANSTYLYLSGNMTSCVLICPTGTYLVSGSCQTCPSPCFTCQLSSTGIVCLTCLSGLLQLGSSCYNDCPIGFFQSVTRCSICSSVCLSCSGNATNCVTCKNNNGIAPSCVSPANCTSSQYQNSSTTCSNCDNSCLNCYGGASYECLSCANSSNILISGSCTANCPAGSVRNSTNCVTCPSNCLTCTVSSSSLACSSCSSPFILFSSTTIAGVCVQSCSSLNSAAQSYVLVNGQCQLCTIAGCTFCTYTGIQFQCGSCQNTTYLYNQACITVCPSGTMPSGSTCTACTQNCLTCNAAGCTSCKSGFFFQNGNCVNSCGSGSYSLNGACNQCTITNCLACNSTSCLSCQQPYLLSNGQCSSCVSGYYISSGVCQACLMPCLTCLGSNTACTSCASGYLLFNSTNCVVTCPSGYYAATTGSCSACTYTNCQTCTSTSCSSCVSGYVLVGTQSCQTSCPSNMYLSTSTNTCTTCSASCSSCTSSTSCLACLSPFVLSQGYCLSSCPSGMYNANSACITCPSGCKTCISALSCSSCNSGLTLSASGICSVPPNNCSSGYYLNTLNTCSQCYSTCLTCSAGGYSNCITCFTGYNLTNGVCVQFCSADSYYNANNTCQLCNSTFSNCLSCTSSGCLTCAFNYTVLNGNCVQTCPSGTYLSNSVCLSCPAFCLSCSSSSSCNQCINSTLLLISGLCYTSCPAQTYYVNNSCASCYQTCLTCAGSSTNCSSCITPYNLNGNNCTSACPTSTFASNYTCQICSTNCLSCSGLNACSQCSSSLYLINGTCRSTCPSGYYIDASSNRCIQCVSPCLVCSSRTACTSCQSPYTLSNSVCINSNCSAGYYDFSLNTCVNCTVNHCGFCSNTSCSSCLAGYYSIYMNGVLTYCQPACIAGTYADNTTMNCSSCFTNCFSCINSTWCSLCNSGYYVLSLAGANANECVTVCPYGYYQNSSTYQCASCASNCLSCYNQTICLVCSSYYYQLVSNGSVSCVSNCPDMYYTPTAVDGTGQCGPCGTNCYACLDALTCTQCLSSSYVIVSGTCTPYNCVHCFTCNANNNTCSQCISSYYLFNNGCTATCPDAYYPDNSTEQCLPCVTNCLLCQEANSCMLCISGYVFINGTGCENKGLLDYGILGNMSGFTSNITRIISIVYVSTSSGPIVFGAVGSTYGPMQFCQFMYLLQGSSGGNEEVNNFLNSLSAVSYTTSSGTNSNDNNQSSQTNSQKRLLTAISYTATFLQTNMPIFLIMAGFICAYIVVLVLERYSNSCCGSCPSLLKYANYMCEFMKLRFKYIYVDTVMWISYLPFLYFAILQLKSGRFDTGMQIFSSLLAIAIIIIYPLYPIFILRKIFDRSDNEAEDLRNYKSITLKEPPRVDNEKGMCEDFTCCELADTRKALVEMSLSPYIDKVVRPVFNQFNHEHPEYSEFRYFKVEHWRLAYAPIKYVRKFIYVMIVALCPDPITTLILLIVVTCAYMAYLVVLKPKEKLYLVLQMILESVLLFFIVFMLVYVSMGGTSVSSLSVATHAIGFLIANSTLAIAIILNLMAYYTIFCCIYDFIKHLRDRAIEDDIKQKAFEEVVDEKDKIDQKEGKEKEEIDIRKSLKRGDDQMTVENNQQDHYVQYDLDEKEFNVKDSMIKKKKTFEDEITEEDFTNLKSTKNPKARNNRKDRRKSNHRIQEESHTSQEMGQSKIIEQDFSDGLIKDRASKYKREVNKNDVNIDRGELRQPTDKFRKKNHKISEPQEQESLEVLRPDKKTRGQDEFVADIDTQERMVPNKKMEYDIDTNFVQRQSKRRQKKNEGDQDIPEANTRQREGANRQAKLKGERDLEDANMVNRDRRKKEDPYGFNDPSDPTNAKTYDRQDRRNKNPVGNDEIEDVNTFNRNNNNKNKDNMPDANMYDRKGDNRRGQNEKDLQEGNMKERNKKKPENPFGEFQQMFASQDAQALREAQILERKRKEKEKEKEQSLSNEKLVSGFLENATPAERQNQAKKYQNLHYKGSDDEEEVREGQVVQAKNRFRKNVKNSQKNIPEGDINAVGKDIKTKKADRIQSNKEFVEDNLEQAKYKQRQGKDIQKIKSLNEKAEQGVQEGLTYNREKKVAERKKTEEKRIQSGNLLSPSPVKPKKKPAIYDDLAEDLTESVEFQEGKKQEMRLKRAPQDEEFVQSSMGKPTKSQAERQKRAQDNRMQVSDNLQESYEDVIRKNKDQVFKPVAGNKSNLIALGEDDQFEQVSYSRPESKIERSKSRNKDMGLGVNSHNASQASDNESRDIRKQRSSAIQRQRKKGTLNVNDKEENEDDINVGSDSRRISHIKKKSKVVKGVLNIDDKSENEDIENLQL